MSWLSALGFGSDKRDTQDDVQHICGYDVVSDRGESLGIIEDYVMDGNDKLRYLVVNSGSIASGKKVTVPVGMAQIEDNRQEVILKNISRDRFETMPAYDESVGFSDDYESNVMSSVYPNQRPYTTNTGNLDYDRYEDFRTPERLQLIEERLQVDKRPELRGEVRVGKHVEMRQESVDVPVSRERLVIERSPADETMAGDVGNRSLTEDEITIPLYTEEVEVTKRPVVAEEVTIRKERDTETRTVQETVGREFLDVDDPDQLASSDRGQPGNIRDESMAGQSARKQGKKIEVEVIPLDDNR